MGLLLCRFDTLCCLRHGDHGPRTRPRTCPRTRRLDETGSRPVPAPTPPTSPRGGSELQDITWNLTRSCSAFSPAVRSGGSVHTCLAVATVESELPGLGGDYVLRVSRGVDGNPQSINSSISIPAVGA